MNTVLAHELCHVRRRDNLAAFLAHDGGNDVLVPSSGVVDRCAADRGVRARLR
jgi:hypothetical protein